ncbi:ribonuclease HII [Candidatus Azambacteria bacterium RBG_16_47_10]|uniref:Ribonuclease HII n=1 Tax=Candidatus Azambacteria bacterium RBG_16_47_10 TaxID=1797292 RepID=A0A1F5B153_9BACT|nr:MAG: ribonuclease HII [Candidatus Azambacteria bacterium RBG_16_47_10]
MLVGVDEAGRGPLAGPVVAAAVAICLSDDALVEEFMKLGVRDSKFILPKKREQLYGILTAHTAVSWGVASVDEKAIDRINILQASLLAMKYAVDAMMKKQSVPQQPYLYIDGRDIIPDMSVDQKAVIGGDAIVFSIAAASIIAKVTRDRMMGVYAKEYPQYQFEQHKGYGTKLHYAAMREHGPCPIHRKSFLKSVIDKGAKGR